MRPYEGAEGLFDWLRCVEAALAGSMDGYQCPNCKILIAKGTTRRAKNRTLGKHGPECPVYHLNLAIHRLREVEALAAGGAAMDAAR
jgi:hypothetical protein